MWREGEWDFFLSLLHGFWSRRLELQREGSQSHAWPHEVRSTGICASRELSNHGSWPFAAGGGGNRA